MVKLLNDERKEQICKRIRIKTCLSGYFCLIDFTGKSIKYYDCVWNVFQWAIA